MGKTKGFDPEGLGEVPPQRAQTVAPATKVPDQQEQGPQLHTLVPANSNDKSQFVFKMSVKQSKRIWQITVNENNAMN